MSPVNGSTACFRVTTDEGFTSYERTDDDVFFKLSYRDPPQAEPLESVRDAGLALDSMRARAEAAMRRIVQDLGKRLDGEIGGEFVVGECPEVVMTEPHPMARWDYQKSILRVRIDGSTEFELKHKREHPASDRFVAGEMVQAVVRKRVVQLVDEYEGVRREVLGNHIGDTVY